MEMRTQLIQVTKILPESMCIEQSQNDEQKLRGIGSMVKELKNQGNSEIYCNISWMQIRKHGNFLLEYLSRQKIQDRTVFFETLASFDSLLSIFKLNLFMELRFRKSFYRNIQREFQLLCLQYNFATEERQQKQQEFQLYSILFLLVMLIYFSGKKQCSQFKRLPLQIVNKSFINSLITLQINITQKNQRIIGLILAYLVKNINLKIYGEKMLKFILNHFNKIHMPRTVYHFVYCLREIHLEREIDVKIVMKFSLIQKLWKFWAQTFACKESIYLVDYINLVLNKYPSLINMLKNIEEPMMTKLSDFDRINEFSIVHQGLVLEIMTKINPIMDKQKRQNMILKAFLTCEKLDFSLKLISCFITHQTFNSTMQHIFPFVTSFKSICQNKELKSILFSVQILSQMVQSCFDNKAWGMIGALREKLYPTVEELKEFHVCKRDIARIEECFSMMISIQYQTLS